MRKPNECRRPCRDVAARRGGAAAADRDRRRRLGQRRLLRDLVRLDGARLRVRGDHLARDRRPGWGRFDRIWLAATACLCVYTFLSAAWAGSAGDAVDAGLRMLVYLTGIAGALLVLRRGDLSCWLAGLVLGVAGVCVYSLATRLFPSHFGGLNLGRSYRLFRSGRLLERARDLRRIALAARLGLVAVGRWRVLRVLVGGRAGRARSDALLHVQPWRLARADGRRARR